MAHRSGGEGFPQYILFKIMHFILNNQLTTVRRHVVSHKSMNRRRHRNGHDHEELVDVLQRVTQKPTCKTERVLNVAGTRISLQEALSTVEVMDSHEAHILLEAFKANRSGFTLFLRAIG
jgi:hypothetical protein